jgi:hypothetical protein
VKWGALAWRVRPHYTPPMRPPPLASADRVELDDPALARRSETRTPRQYDCDVCGKRFDGEPAGSGLFVWTRGDEVRYEEPPLCEECASKVTLGALQSFEDEEEEEG